jgi:CubicO group peptidase (beta-lactamase class C family)
MASPEPSGSSHGIGLVGGGTRTSAYVLGSDPFERGFHCPARPGGSRVGRTTKPTELASVRKSLLSALIGIAVSDHLINLDSTLGELGIDDNPPSLTEVEKAATVRELLEARSGVYHPALYETPGMAKAIPPRGSHAPGTFWYYNNWDFNVLGTIYEHATGTGIFDAFDQKIAKPIGMQDYRPQDGSYFRSEASIHPAYPIRMSARDLARFALLYLRKGNWVGRQIVPEGWVEEHACLFEIGVRLGLWLSLVDRFSGRRYGAYGYLARG